MFKNWIILFFLILFFIIGINYSYGQCSMCRAVLQSEEGQATAKGINNGILYLMAIPYLLVAIVGWKVFKILKK
jgi:Na+/H+ antiporter NhaC